MVEVTYKSTYQAAATVAPAIEGHFARLLATAVEQGETDLAPEPSVNVIETIIDVAFWASLRREEGRSPKVSLVYLPPVLAGQPLEFEERIALTPHVLTKLAPAVERSGYTPGRLGARWRIMCLGYYAFHTRLLLCAGSY